jgi:hypothetical protein
MSRLGVLLALLLTAFAVAASAGAASAPPRFGIQPLFRELPIIFLPRSERDRASCSASAPKSRGTVRAAKKKVAPVACEQPPRSHVRDAGSSVVLAFP